MDALEDDERFASSTGRRHRQPSSNASGGALDTLEFSQVVIPEMNDAMTFQNLTMF